MRGFSRSALTEDVAVEVRAEEGSGLPSEVDASCGLSTVLTTGSGAAVMNAGGYGRLTVVDNSERGAMTVAVAVAVGATGRIAAADVALRGALGSSVAAFFRSGEESFLRSDEEILGKSVVVRTEGFDGLASEVNVDRIRDEGAA